MVELDWPSDRSSFIDRRWDVKMISERKSKTSAPPRAGKGRPDRRGGSYRSGRLGGFVAFALVALSLPLAIGIALAVMSWQGASSEPKELRAAIVDQLALTNPNPSFAETATNLLQQSGYTVDYYPAEQVTVDFYRDLPTHKYDLLVLRSHMARVTEEGLDTADPVRRRSLMDAFGHTIFLFTSEPYDRMRYAGELENQRLASVRYPVGQRDEPYFGITPYFIGLSMRGSFDGATIILMGCDGLTFTDTAAALVRKGAGRVISWYGPVSASHTDAATERLLQHLVVDKLDAQEAVARTMNEVGPDPEFGSFLRVYPPEAAASTIR